MSAPKLKCSECPSQTFDSKEQRRRHCLEYHSESFVVSVTTKSGAVVKVVVEQVDGKYKCPFCAESVTTKRGSRKHVKENVCGWDNNQDEDEDEPGVTLPAVTLPESQVVPPLPEPPQLPETRAFDDAVLYSCGESHASDKEKRKTLGIVESLGLEPISIKDAVGIEQNALAHATVISRLPAGPVELGPIVPQKRKLDENQ
ncbi:hypothetical protein BGX34_006828, partial [Mortierella sp. NVP85]